MSKIALVVRADFSMTRLDVSEDFLHKMQGAVDGLIQPVDFTNSLTMWVNEEGLLRDDLRVNPFASILFEEFLRSPMLIKGDVVFTGGTDDEGDTLGLAEEMIANLATWANSLKGAWDRAMA